MKKITSALLSLSLLMALAACGGTSSGSEVQSSTPPESTSMVEDTAEPTASGTVVISHEYGETELAINPERVLVMDYGLIDILDSVGIEIAGVPQGSMPAYLSAFEGSEYLNTGTLKEIDFEAVAEFGPDLILITGRLSSSYDECSEIAPTIYLPMPSADYLTTLGANVEVLAQVFPAKADALHSEYQKLVDAAGALKAEAEVSELTALVVMANDGSLSFFSAGSRYGIVFDTLGFTPVAENIDDSTHGAEGSFEFFTEVNPDVIFVIDRSAAIGTEGASGAATLLDNDLVNATSAAQNGRIVYLSSDVWYLASGGFAGTGQMIDEVAAALQ